VRGEAKVSFDECLPLVQKVVPIAQKIRQLPRPKRSLDGVATQARAAIRRSLISTQKQPEITAAINLTSKLRKKKIESTNHVAVAPRLGGDIKKNFRATCDLRNMHWN